MPGYSLALPDDILLAVVLHTLYYLVSDNRLVLATVLLRSLL